MPLKEAVCFRDIPKDLTATTKQGFLLLLNVAANHPRPAAGAVWVTAGLLAEGMCRLSSAHSEVLRELLFLLTAAPCPLQRSEELSAPVPEVQLGRSVQGFLCGFFLAFWLVIPSPFVHQIKTHGP